MDSYILSFDNNLLFSVIIQILFTIITLFMLIGFPMLFIYIIGHIIKNKKFNKEILNELDNINKRLDNIQNNKK